MKITSIEFVRSVANVHDLPSDTLSQIAFAGRSNVGKSSLINCLLNRNRMAKISSSPGKTRQLNFFRINEAFYFVDLPGYGFAKAAKDEILRWKNLIEAFFQQSKNLAGVIALIDSRIGPTHQDLQLLNWLQSLNILTILVATKADKQSKTVLNNNLKRFSQKLPPDLESIIPFSARNGTGKKQLWRKILTLVE